MRGSGNGGVIVWAFIVVMLLSVWKWLVLLIGITMLVVGIKYLYPYYRDYKADQEEEYEYGELEFHEEEEYERGR